MQRFTSVDYSNPRVQDQLLALQGQAGNRPWIPNYDQMLAAQITRKWAAGERPSATGISQAHMLGSMRNLRAAQNQQQNLMWEPFQRATAQMHAMLKPQTTIRDDMFSRYYGR